jgi:hypothetical protein
MESEMSITKDWYVTRDLDHFGSDTREWSGPWTKADAEAIAAECAAMPAYQAKCYIFKAAQRPKPEASGLPTMTIRIR